MKLVATGVVGAALVAVVGRFVLFPKLGAEGSQSSQAGWIDYLKTWVPVAFATSPVAIALLQALRRVLAVPLEIDLKRYFATPAYKDKLSFLERFHDDFKLFAETYLRGRRTFVLVDDLDRCEVTKGAELLQALSLMLPAKQPIFLILALDRQKLAMGVAVRSKEVLPYMALSASGSADVADMAEDDRGAHARAGLAYGYEFIEKFIQLPFRVPMLTEAGLGPFLDSLLSPSPVVSGSGAAPSRSLLEEIVEHDSPEVRRVMKMAAPALGNNPRRLKQFLNLFRLRHYIAQKTGQLRVEGAVGLTLPQLGKIVAIELRWPLLLDRLLREPDALRAFVAKEDLPSLRPWATDREMITLRDHMPDSGAADYLLNSGLLVHLPTLYGTAANDSPAPAPIEMSAK